jgi:hypothetical protein
VRPIQEKPIVPELGATGIDLVAIVRMLKGGDPGYAEYQRRLSDKGS